jgi:acetyl-CoA carboxylase alpha subunit
MSSFVTKEKIMLTLESAIERIQQLPPEQQKQVFQLIEDLEKQTQNQEKTFIEVAHEFIGCLESNIEDLSYNPKYLQEFGK